MFDNYESAGYGQAMGMQVIAHHSLSGVDTDRQPHVVWSGDSSTIAYEDKDGLWVWDIFEKTDPELVVNDDLAPLLDLSRSGRYMRFGSETTWMLLDTHTDQTFDNAVVTPDESNLIFINAGYPENTLDLDRGGETNCQVPLMETCPILIQHEGMKDWFWYRNDVIMLLSCYEDGCLIVGYPWQLSIRNLYGDRRLEIPSLPLVNALAYDAENDQPVVAVEGYALEFGFYPGWERDEPGDGPFDGEILDLREQLDSPILDLEWGESIFFEEVGP